MVYVLGIFLDIINRAAGKFCNKRNVGQSKVLNVIFIQFD